MHRRHFSECIFKLVALLFGIVPILLALRLPDGIVEFRAALRWCDPAGHGHLLLGVEVHAFLALDVQVAEE